jgi:hypothetical protein
MPFEKITGISPPQPAFQNEGIFLHYRFTVHTLHDFNFIPGERWGQGTIITI